MSSPARGRLLLLGFGSTVAVIALSIGIARLTGAVGWQVASIAGLLALLVAFSLPAIQTGSQLPGFADASEIYMETLAREVSHGGLSHYQPSTINLVWLWAMLPPTASLIFIGLLF